MFLQAYIIPSGPSVPTMATTSRTVGMRMYGGACCTNLNIRSKHKWWCLDPSHSILSHALLRAAVACSKTASPAY